MRCQRTTSLRRRNLFIGHAAQRIVRINSRSGCNNLGFWFGFRYWRAFRLNGDFRFFVFKRQEISNIFIRLSGQIFQPRKPFITALVIKIERFSKFIRIKCFFGCFGLRYGLSSSNRFHLSNIFILGRKRIQPPCISISFNQFLFRARVIK